ncbi:hypothetical protein [Vibrio nigripulchritudo]|uniref:hypothetical protein n=1 Tax=Vibrio nigripulchritudo TaxID=28173 RepID=UPI002491EEAE|nr:hypothetical protein [Vibrio nigripulchritudo]BDU38710.1 hypothetical protein TUMSATVNIG2_31790 [Vibrio nigripulchritudo]BDU44430.1 hypothetical protein TUMSATVNIG3_32280 [Vibrio nigripulchritudo]
MNENSNISARLYIFSLFCTFLAGLSGSYFTYKSTYQSTALIDFTERLNLSNKQLTAFSELKVKEVIVAGKGFAEAASTIAFMNTEDDNFQKEATSILIEMTRHGLLISMYTDKELSDLTLAILSYSYAYIHGKTNTTQSIYLERIMAWGVAYNATFYEVAGRDFMHTFEYMYEVECKIAPHRCIE